MVWSKNLNTYPSLSFPPGHQNRRLQGIEKHHDHPPTMVRPHGPLTVAQSGPLRSGTLPGRIGPVLRPGPFYAVPNRQADVPRRRTGPHDPIAVHRAPILALRTGRVQRGGAGFDGGLRNNPHPAAVRDHFQGTCVIEVK